MEGRTTLRPQTVDVMRSTGVYRWSPADTQPLPEQGDAASFTPPPSYLSGYTFELWVRRHIWQFSYEAMQPPLFYALAAPVWAAADRLAGPFDAVFAVRVLNALLLALLVPLALVMAWRLTPSADVPIAAAAVLVGMPGLALNGSQITNDTLAAVLGAATVLASLELAAKPRARWALIAGALLGATLLTKLTAAGVAAALGLALLWPLLARSGGFWRQVKLAALAAGAATVLLAPWLVLNLRAYGHLVPSAEAARLMGAATSGASYTFAQSLNYAFTTFWTGEHENTVPLTGLMALACIPFTIAGLVGVQRLLRSRGRTLAALPPLAIMLTAVVAETAWALAVPRLSGVGGMTPGRYLYPIAVPAAVLICAGVFALLKPELTRLAVAGVVLLGVLNLALYAEGFTAWYQEPRTDPLASDVSRDVNLDGAYQGVDIYVDRLLVDRDEGTIWFHLIVTNTRSDGADWWSEPLITFPNGRHVWAAYAASTPFPETLEPHSQYAGWVKVRAIQRPEAGQHLRLLFDDIAVNGYREVGQLQFDLVVPKD